MANPKPNWPQRHRDTERTVHLKGEGQPLRALRSLCLCASAAVFLMVWASRSSEARAQDNWLEEAVRKQRPTFDGTQVEAAPDVKKDRRGKVIVRRVKPQAKSDWNTDPTALPYFFYQIRERTAGKFPIFMDNEGIELVGNEIFDHPLIYFTSHFPIQLTPAEVE